jgi:hypothetical protein
VSTKWKEAELGAYAKWKNVEHQRHKLCASMKAISLLNSDEGNNENMEHEDI